MSLKPIAAESRIIAAANVEVRDLGDAAVLVGETDDDHFGLSPTGRRIWLLLEEADSVNDIVNRIATEFEITTEECRDDVTGFLEELLSLGLAEVEGQ